MKLSLEDMAKSVEADTVVGRRDIDKKCILTIHFNSIAFQFHILLLAHDSKHINVAFDAIEKYLGTREEFERIMGIILLDRGAEFDGFRELEISCLEPGKKRWKYFFAILVLRIKNLIAKTTMLKFEEYFLRNIRISIS